MATDIDTIAALATPAGRGSVGIIRVSGPAAAAIAAAILGRLPAPRHATHQPFADANGEPLDEGLALYFPAPHSFTGEDVLELQGHGGPVVMDLLLRRTLELGARPARTDSRETSKRMHWVGAAVAILAATGPLVAPSAAPSRP